MSTTNEQIRAYARSIEFLYTSEDFGKVKSEEVMVAINKAVSGRLNKNTVWGV